MSLYAEEANERAVRSIRALKHSLVRVLLYAERDSNEIHGNASHGYDRRALAYGKTTFEILLRSRSGMLKADRFGWMQLGDNFL